MAAVLAIAGFGPFASFWYCWGWQAWLHGPKDCFAYPYVRWATGVSWLRSGGAANAVLVFVSALPGSLVVFALVQRAFGRRDSQPGVYGDSEFAKDDAMHEGGIKTDRSVF